MSAGRVVAVWPTTLGSCRLVDLPDGGCLLEYLEHDAAGGERWVTRGQGILFNAREKMLAAGIRVLSGQSLPTNYREG